MLDPDFDIAAALESSLQSSRRADGWTTERQHGFLTDIAAGASIDSAAKAQGLSPSSAYSFRHSAKGAAFSIGWHAAQLLQRQRLADEVSARAFDGQTVTITRADGSTVTRHFYDNRLAMSVLARLDRIAAGQPGTDTPESQAARLAAAEWDRYLDILGGGPARAGLFLAARTGTEPGAPEIAAIAALARADLYERTGAGALAELDLSDLDPARRAQWTAEQWTRAEAAGLLALAPHADGGTPHSQHSPDDDPVWWCDAAEEWRTSFPPPADFDGEEEGRYGHDDYHRSLTAAEEDGAGLDPDGPGEKPEDDAALAEHTAERDRWFAAAACEANASAAAREANASAAAEPDAEQASEYDWAAELRATLTREEEQRRAA